MEKNLRNSKAERKATTSVIVQERQRISRELHDRVLQILSGVKLRAEACLKELSTDQTALQRELRAIEKDIDTATVEIRNILTETQGRSELKAGSLERRLRAELEIFRARTGFNLDFQCTVNAGDLPYAVERELYFTLREGVLNAVRHARASRLTLSLSKDGATCVARLSDNGIGFDTSLVEGGAHYGIKSMRERTKRVGGELTFESTPGAGTQLTLKIPLVTKANRPK